MEFEKLRDIIVEVLNVCLLYTSCLENTATAPDGKRYGRDHQARMLRPVSYTHLDVYKRQT